MGTFETVDHWGNVIEIRRDWDLTGMLAPVECLRCGKAYDLTKVEPIARYGDCTVYTTPCCKRQVDDRTFVSNPAIRKLNR